MNLSKFKPENKLGLNLSQKHKESKELDFEIKRIVEDSKDIENFMEKSLLLNHENIKDSI
jgi:hypothetical protein